MIVIRKVQLDGRTCDVLIDENRFSEIGPDLSAPEAEEIDGSGFAILPPFYNAHTHAAMVVLRGAADDLNLFDWLSGHIWPAEAKLTKEDVYEANIRAIREMILSGTVFFNDMYWYPETAVQAADEMGVRACIGSVFLDGIQNAQEDQVRNFERLLDAPRSRRIQIGLAPHAVYTVSPEKLRLCGTLARKHGARVHIHASETLKEVEDCLREHGVTPIRHLENCGILETDAVLAHCVHLTDADREILVRRQVTLAHCPRSNMKLASGMFSWKAAIEAGCSIALGTDGAASSNNLDLGEEVKFAALSAKIQAQDPTAGSAKEVFHAATGFGAERFGIDAGEIAVGKLADCILVNLSNIRLKSGHSLISDMVYSADSECIDTVICDGRILLKNRQFIV